MRAPWDLLFLLLSLEELVEGARACFGSFLEWMGADPGASLGGLGAGEGISQSVIVTACLDSLLAFFCLRSRLLRLDWGFCFEGEIFGF